MTRRRPTRGQRTFPKLTTAAEGRDALGKAARMLYGDDARPALLARALMEAMLAEAAAVSDPDERQAVLNAIHVRTYEATHGPVG